MEAGLHPVSLQPPELHHLPASSQLSEFDFADFIFFDDSYGSYGDKLEVGLHPASLQPPELHHLPASSQLSEFDLADSDFFGDPSVYDYIGYVGRHNRLSCAHVSFRFLERLGSSILTTPPPCGDPMLFATPPSSGDERSRAFPSLFQGSLATNQISTRIANAALDRRVVAARWAA